MRNKITTGRVCKVCGGTEFTSGYIAKLECVVNGEGTLIRFLDTDMENAREATYTDTGPFTCLNCGVCGAKLEDLTTEITMRLFEKPFDEGLTNDEIISMLQETGDKAVLLVEFPAKAHECTAMGCIDMEYASNLSDTDREKLGDYIAWILDDMNNENANGLYEFNGATIK